MPGYAGMMSVDGGSWGAVVERLHPGDGTYNFKDSHVASFVGDLVRACSVLPAPGAARLLLSGLPLFGFYSC